MHDVKRSLKKIIYKFTLYGPEIGLCKCLFKYAWFNYPVVPEITHAMMGRARRMVSSFMQDFMQGFIEEQSSNDHYRISNKVAQTTADDYYDYQAKHANTNYGPFRRVGEFVGNLPENVPIIEKSNPKLDNLVQMLKNLQPKANVTDFVIRLARNIKSQPRRPNNVQQFRIVSDDGDEIKYFTKHRHNDESKVELKAEVVTVRPAMNKTVAIKSGTVTEGRSSVSSNVRQVAQPKIERVGLSYGPPPAGLPTFNDLPPPDYTYFKDGVHHHIHDLRKDKKPLPVKGGGWLTVDFEDAILSALGLSPRAHLVQPTVKACGKSYVIAFIFRTIQMTLFS